MAHGPLKVFIADDSKPVADMLTELLTQPGSIEVVGTGATETAAIESIRTMKPDVVVLDLQLESGSGTNVIRAVRAIDDLASTKLMVTSNHTAPQLKAGCLELGADGYFDKVKELAQLAARLAELAREKQG
ncbi:MAG TPA: response regulator [Usitatibacter sp.]|nr:response regulator [Usitatibacter sp.]